MLPDPAPELRSRQDVHPLSEADAAKHMLQRVGLTMNVAAAGCCLAFRSGSNYLIVKWKKGLCLDFQAAAWLGSLEHQLSSGSPFLASSGSQLLALSFWFLASGSRLLALGFWLS